MPSPIAHVAAGYAIYKLYATRKPSMKHVRFGPLAGLLALSLLLSLLPDFDIIPGFLLGDFDQFHNTVTNSLIVGMVVAIIFALIVRVWAPSQFVFWFVLVLLTYETHVVMDYLGSERGVMLFWPVTAERFAPPVHLFYGFHRSDGWISIRHLWTFLTEIIFLAIVFVSVQLLLKHGAESGSVERS